MPISWTRFLTMWVGLAVAMSANGIFRELVLRRAVGSPVADILSAVLGIVLITLITRVGFGQMLAPTTRSLALASAMLVALTVVFETVLGVFVDRKTLRQLIEHYALWHGELWPIVLAFLAYTPFLWARIAPRRWS
jgi:hypothetical protein